MSSNPPPSAPIPINRERSPSVDSDVPGLSLGSTAPQSPLQSPLLSNRQIPASSPILSYFMSRDGVSKSPTSLSKNPLTLNTTMEKDVSNGNGASKLSPVAGHHRAMSMNSAWPRFPPPGPPVPSQNTPAIKNSHERSAGIFRRLSLSGNAPLTRPAVPASDRANQDTDDVFKGAQAIVSTAATLPRTSRPHGRRATLTPGDTPKPRAPSPIGERMLKGQFDGFV